MNKSKTKIIREIAQAINKRVLDECKKNLSNRAVARCVANVTNTALNNSIPRGEFFLTNRPNDKLVSFGRDFTGSGTTIRKQQQSTSTVGRSVYKNTKMGEVLTKFYEGCHSYQTPTVGKRMNTVSVEIINKATYCNINSDAKDLTIRISGDDFIYRYARLNELLDALKKQQEELDKLRKEQNRLEEEKRRKEEEERLAREQAAAAEQRKIEEEIAQNKEQERKIREDVERLEKEMDQAAKHILSVQHFLRTGVELRSQHLLDASQEDAKRL